MLRSIIIAALALGLPPWAAGATTLSDGSKVRIRSNSIDAGWHSGRVTRDDRECWMVLLDRPTSAGYTMLALLVIDALQLGRTGEWTAIDAKRAIAAEPAHCLVPGSH